MEEEPKDRGILNRDVPQKEGYGMSRDLPAGTIVYRWARHSAVAANQILVTAEPDKPPFFSIPIDAVDWDDPRIEWGA